jgi:SNF2 family DNA or RNA helicase
LADVMVRHTRGQVHLDLPPRQAHTVRLELTPDERRLYDEVSELVRRGFELAAAAGGGAQAGRFTLQILQREIGSCPQAAESTLRALAAQPGMQPQRPEILALGQRAAKVLSWAKADAVEKLLAKILASGRGASERVMIFTHFRRTIERLAARLRRLEVPFVVYHGGLSAAAKDQAIRDFESDRQVLLSSEAAGEGRNLQFCRTMINFDLPWNPMRIEQRVGRIHRIGQDREVHVYNLSARGTVEDHLLEILDRKLNMFELVIGEMGMILGQLADERDFEELVLEAWVRGATPEEVRAGFEQLGETMAEARRAYLDAREYDENLFGEDFASA